VFEGEKIVRDIQAGRFKLSFHAALRMVERGLQIGDIIEIAKTSEEVHWQPQKETYRIRGRTLDGEAGLIAAKYDQKQQVLIVTLMPRRKKR
jgi:hypothetical protein